VLEAWDRQCAFCGYDGQITGASVGIEAAHVRWFAFGGPDALDNGLALCALHHKLFDLGALGLSLGLQVMVSAKFSARTPAGPSTTCTVINSRRDPARPCPRPST
jgi:putative restriction endonuclease